MRVQERDALIEHLTLRPSAMWRTGTIWAFRNEAKMYGSPMFDRVLSSGDPSAPDPMPAVLAALQVLSRARSPFQKSLVL